MSLNNNQQAFFELLRAGLWNEEARLSKFGAINLKEICRIAEEQSVVGLVAAGLEHVTDVKLPKEEVLLVVGQMLQLEQRNKAMNAFVAELIGRLKDAGINALLVKGQGIAQCYEKPLWRACGDVDLVLDIENYEKVKLLFNENGYQSTEEDTERLHSGYVINGWLVELHGTLHTGCWKKLDRQIDAVQEDTLLFHNVRKWRYDEVDVLLPVVDNDLIFIFTHILQHFYKGGIGLRQVCDLTRFLWSFRESINGNKLDFRMCTMGVLAEWQTFGAIMVDYLGCSKDVMPLYSPQQKWKRKGAKVLNLIFETGNFGHNREIGYIIEKPFVIRKLISLRRSTWDRMRQGLIFPMNSIRVWMNMFSLRIILALKGQ